MDPTNLPSILPENLIGRSPASPSAHVNGGVNVSPAVPEATPYSGRRAPDQMRSPESTSALGSAILAEQAQIVADAPEGERNDTLNRCCFVVGLHLAGRINRDEAIAVMTQAGEACGLLPGEVEPLVGRVIDEGAAKNAAILAQMPPAPTKRRGGYLKASSLSGSAPDRVWLVPGLIPVGAVTLLGGDGGTGKSLLALQCGAAVVAQLEFLGFPTLSGPVLYIGAEDDKDEFHRRVDKICAGYGITKDQLDDLYLWPLAGEDALLARDGDTLSPTPLYREIVELVAELKPKLIVFDTLADLFPANENDRAKARQFIQMLNRIALDHECAVVLLNHPSLTGMSSGSGTSGSTGWNNSVRSRLYLERIDDEDDRRVLTTKKSNYGKIGDETVVEWRDGFFVPLNQIHVRCAAEQNADAVFLKLLAEYTARGVEVGPHNQSSGAAAVFADDPDSTGINKKGFTAAQHRLLKAGKIRIVTVGSPGRSKKILEVV